MGLSWLRKIFVAGRKTSDNRNSIAHVGQLLPGVYYRMEFEPEFRLTNVGENIEELLGYETREVLNRNKLLYLQLVHPEHETVLGLKKMHCMKSREVKTMHYNMLTKSRSVKLIEDHFIGEYDLRHIPALKKAAQSG